MDSIRFTENEDVKSHGLMDSDKEHDHVVDTLLTVDSSVNELIRYSGSIKSKTVLISSRGDKLNSNSFTSKPVSIDPDILESKIQSYLKAFGVIGPKNSVEYKTNTPNIDNRLHIDTSSCTLNGVSFDNYIDGSNFKPVSELILNTILAYPRQYVIFIGAGFKDLLSEYTTEIDRFSFILTSPKKINQKNTVCFTRVSISYCGKKLIAGIAESFHEESFDEIMLEKYGQESVYLLNRGILLSNPLWNNQLNLTK